jgi:hypothetical protein
MPKRVSKQKLAPTFRPKPLKKRARGKAFEPGNTFGLATRFKKGEQSPNPGGRAAFAEISRASRAYLAAKRPGDPYGRTHAEYFVEILGSQGQAGDRAAIAELADRAEGRPAVTMNVNEGSDGIKAILDIFEAKSLEVGPPDDDGDLPQLTEGVPADEQI